MVRNKHIVAIAIEAECTIIYAGRKCRVSYQCAVVAAI